MLWILSGCSATWHYKKAKQKDPSLFVTQVDTVVREIGAVSTDINCDSITTEGNIIFLPTNDGKDSVRIEFKTEYRYRDLTSDDSLRIKNNLFIPMTAEDSSKIYKALRIDVDCPDCQDIVKTKYVELKPTFWEKIQYTVYLVIVVLILAACYHIFIRPIG